MNDLDFVGQTLDGKYQMTRELGRGGMGTVYLATHLGTERPVAVKIISPQYMQRVEFVERFRREARAAGRLRHPNVVNVTDFGFAETREGQVAYLVMEYLDGCTLGEILDEEKNLPVGWTLDILEQVCSAVQEAHNQGIIHRDLKPDNIWLEPNQRGGYTVKVLDFGIAKLEEHEANVANGESFERFHGATPTLSSSAQITLAGGRSDGTNVDGAAKTHIPKASANARRADQDTPIAEAGTVLLDPVISEGATAIFDGGDISDEYQDTIGTQVIGEGAGSVRVATAHESAGHSLHDSRNSSELTRVGAVLGTPLYMSPEQCRGEHLDPRSDIYSLGVIAYQMLSGSPPFEGDFKDVMESHKSVEPAPLKAKRVRKKLRRVIHSALEKDLEMRPHTAEAFASELRSRSEGIFDLLRRALVIYSEHLPKFLLLTTFFSIPIILLTLILLAVSFLKVSDLISETGAKVLVGIFGVLLTIASAFCTSLIIGTVAWVATQYLAVPLRPIRLRPALEVARKRWKRLAGAGILSALLPFVVCAVAALAGFIGFAYLLAIFYPVTGSTSAIFVAGGIGAAIIGTIGFFAAYVMWMLVAPVVMMENVRIVEALRRSRLLVNRAFATSLGAVLIIFLIPMLAAGMISYIVNVSAKAFDPKPPADAAEIVQGQTETPAGPESPAKAQAEKRDRDFSWIFGTGTAGRNTSGQKLNMRTRVKNTLLESLIQVFWLPIQILVFSFSGIIVALLYLKTRLAGGESMNDLIERFEDDGRPRKKWQERVRQRLIQSGRLSSNPSR